MEHTVIFRSLYGTLYCFHFNRIQQRRSIMFDGEHVITYFGPPKLFYSENWREFINQLIWTMFHTWGGDVNFLNGWPCHSQCLSNVETKLCRNWFLLWKRIKDWQIDNILWHLGYHVVCFLWSWNIKESFIMLCWNESLAGGCLSRRLNTFFRWRSLEKDVSDEFIKQAKFWHWVPI